MRRGSFQIITVSYLKKTLFKKKGRNLHITFRYAFTFRNSWPVFNNFAKMYEISASKKISQLLIFMIKLRLCIHRCSTSITLIAWPIAICRRLSRHVQLAVVILNRSLDKPTRPPFRGKLFFLCFARMH